MSRKSAISIFMVAAATACGLYLSRGPWLAYQQQKQLADVATRDMLKAEGEKNNLLLQKARYESPLGKEELARSNRYIKPGEELLSKE